MIVIDASSIARYILLEPGWEKVEEFLKNDLVSLEYTLVEVSNALWKHYALYNRIERDEFERRCHVIDFLPSVVLFENPLQYLKEARKIAAETGITVYDALYITQGLRYGTLATSDEKQGKIAKRLGVEVIYL